MFSAMIETKEWITQKLLGLAIGRMCYMKCHYNESREKRQYIQGIRIWSVH